MAKQERAIRTREKILVAAAEVFAEVGYDAATIAEVLKRSEVTKGALYFHFSSKDDLAQAVLAEQLSSLPQVPPQELVLQEGLDESLMLAYLLGKGDPMVRGGIRLTVDQGTSQDVLDRAASMQNWIDHNAEILERAKQGGELLPHVDVAAAAKIFVAAFTGVQILSKIMTGHTDMTERMTDVQKHLMATLAAPGVLVRLDFGPDRGARVYEAAMKQHHTAAEPASA
ncbi:ScbR family autoregulator-binding transcription factor [Streptomyces echinatus]|uniref:AcrR family transcriptional regulator n=1 Tax=Streptomyces echinatus TaxID=67293 RepID=A0A7W9Q3H6_9ACTN|nr:ScbR family autoregulator-binding transcription factor [Streptomyces echinatus]MBB5932458.1 AcrR family transcriptional regulator [Streptomyces echinatus]